MQSGAVWLWRERRGAALGRCRNGGAQPRASAGRAQRTKSADPPQAGGAAPRAGTLLGAWPRIGRRLAEPPPRTKSAKSRPEGGWACGPEFAHCWGLPRNKGKIDYPRRKRI